MNDTNIANELVCPISQVLMVDPVSLTCGHTFDRNHLETWLHGQNTCPTCRAAVAGPLTTNWTLKSLIESFAGTRPTSSVNQAAVQLEKQLSVDIDVKVFEKDELIAQLQTAECYYHKEGGLFNVALQMPKCEKRRPVSIVCVIDVSGSMQVAFFKSKRFKKNFFRTD